MEYKHTIQLPQTDFPMKADLARREPALLARWRERDVYGALRREAKGRPTFILLDGPPYANGVIHLGHAVNKVLKDIVVKSRSLDGNDAPYVPGWDCHGLPIEHRSRRPRGASARSSTPRPSGPRAASTPLARSTCSVPTSSAWACSATGTGRG